MVELSLQGPREEHRVAYRLLHHLQPPAGKHRISINPHRNLRKRPLPRGPGTEVKHPISAVEPTALFYLFRELSHISKRDNRKRGVPRKELLFFSLYFIVLLYRYLLAVHDVETCGQTIDAVSNILARQGVNALKTSGYRNILQEFIYRGNSLITQLIA